MNGSVTEVETLADKAEDWVEKEAGLMEHRITTTKAYHSAEHIAATIDKWFESATASLDTETAKYYSEATTLIKGLFK